MKELTDLAAEVQGEMTGLVMTLNIWKERNDAGVTVKQRDGLIDQLNDLQAKINEMRRITGKLPVQTTQTAPGRITTRHHRHAGQDGDLFLVAL